MSRYFKALGLALVAVFAMSAIAASAASADLFRSHKTTTVVTANQEEGAGGQHVFDIPGAATATCGKAFFAGTVSGLTAESVTVHPKYTEKCKLEPFGEATIDTTGCNYVLTTNTTNGHAPVHIECEGTNKIKLTGPLGCTISVPAQTVGQGVVYTNIKNGGTEEEDVTLDITANSIDYTANFACQLAGIPSSGGNATYNGTATAIGYVDEGTTGGTTADGFTYKDNTQTGIWVEST